MNTSLMGTRQYTCRTQGPELREGVHPIGEKAGEQHRKSERIFAYSRRKRFFHMVARRQLMDEQGLVFDAFSTDGVQVAYVT
jgi:hypothetical protein